MTINRYVAMINLLVLALLLGACADTHQSAAGQVGANTQSKFYLVRHAEKQTGPNPSLTRAGAQRAQTLAQIMADKGLTHIHSTNYKRTLETAEPAASRLGIEIALYDPSDLLAFADELRASPGMHLVVGHSNTTAQLAEALSGTRGPAIDEDSEYDRIYIITRIKSGKTTSVIDRFGAK